MTTLNKSLVAPAVNTSKLTYYVRFVLANGSVETLSGRSLFQLTGFSAEATQTLNIGSQSTGAGAGKVTFDPLTLEYTQQNLTPLLFQMLASGTAFKAVDVLAYNASGALTTEYQFGLVAGKSLTIGSSGVATEQLAYGSEQIRTTTPAANGSLATTTLGSWNIVTNTANVAGETQVALATPTAGTLTTLNKSLVAPAVNTSKLTYYVRFVLANGSVETLSGRSLFQLTGFSAEATQTLNIGSQSTGPGAGKVTFDPLTLEYTQQNLTPLLFQMLASGTAFKAVDVLAYNASGALTTEYQFGLVAGKSLTIGSSGVATEQLAYGSEQIRTTTPAANGSLATTTLGSWNIVTNTANVAGETQVALATPAAGTLATLNKSLVAPAVNTSELTYYVRFVLANGSVETLSGRSLFQLTGFSAEATQTLNIGSQSTGAGAGKVTFDPLTLEYTQQNLTPLLFQMLASGKAFQSVDVLAYNPSGALTTEYQFDPWRASP